MMSVTGMHPPSPPTPQPELAFHSHYHYESPPLLLLPPLRPQSALRWLHQLMGHAASIANCSYTPVWPKWGTHGSLSWCVLFVCVSALFAAYPLLFPSHCLSFNPRPSASVLYDQMFSWITDLFNVLLCAWHDAACDSLSSPDWDKTQCSQPFVCFILFIYSFVVVVFFKSMSVNVFGECVGGMRFYMIMGD